MEKESSQGFTLIELMIVVVIMGILAAIAVPIYSSYRVKSDRAEGKVALVTAAQKMERYFAANSTYNGATIGDVAADTIQKTTENKLYQLTFSGTPTDTSFTIQATAQGGQAGDTGCTTLKINQKGQKTPPSCW